MNRMSVIFCSVSLVIAVIVLSVGFNFAAMPRQAIESAKTPAAPESVPDIDLPGFGKVSVMDMMLYYIESPPAPSTDSGDSVPSAKRFGGC